MMKQRMLQKTKISPERLDVSYVTTDIFRSDSKKVTVKLTVTNDNKWWRQAQFEVCRKLTDCSKNVLQSVDSDRFRIPPAETISYNVWNSK